MAEVISKSDILKLSQESLDKWLELNFDRLVGSAIFTDDNTWSSKLIQWGEKHLFARTNNKEFVPSHTGSIIEYYNHLYIFDMKPPKAGVQALKEYLLHTDEDYRIIIRDFPLDTNMFSRNLIDHIGQRYPYLSALRSVFTKRQSKFKTHCSEMHYRQLFRQGINFYINPECTPDELYHVMTEAKQS
jgi:hypothetical protein